MNNQTFALRMIETSFFTSHEKHRTATNGNAEKIEDKVKFGKGSIDKRKSHLTMGSSITYSASSRCPLM
jgi:hypothetical protein